MYIKDQTKRSVQSDLDLHGRQKVCKWRLTSQSLGHTFTGDRYGLIAHG